MPAPLRFLPGGGGCFGRDGPYPEALWLPVIGPSAFVCWRHVVDGMEAHPEGYRTTAEELAGALGLGTGTGPNAPLQRTVRRLERFSIFHPAGNGLYVALRRLPPLPGRYLTRLGTGHQDLHLRLMREAQAASALSEAPGASQVGSQGG